MRLHTRTQVETRASPVRGNAVSGSPTGLKTSIFLKSSHHESDERRDAEPGGSLRLASRRGYRLDFAKLGNQAALFSQAPPEGGNVGAVLR